MIIKDEHEVIEKISSSTWDKQSHYAVPSIFQDINDGKSAYPLKKVRYNNIINGKKLFSEGFKRTEVLNNYTTVCSTNEEFSEEGFINR
jgi:hypothetical protein